MCGMSFQQWSSTQITLFERTRQSAWLDAVTTLLTRSERILVYYNTSLEGVEQPKKWPKPPGNAFSDTLLMSRFQNFAADATKKQTALRAVFWNRASRGFDYLINSNWFGAKHSEKLVNSMLPIKGVRKQFVVDWHYLVLAVPIPTFSFSSLLMTWQINSRVTTKLGLICSGWLHSLCYPSTQTRLTNIHPPPITATQLGLISFPIGLSILLHLIDVAFITP